jgi:H+/Cl- antiporter ClcA
VRHQKKMRGLPLTLIIAGVAILAGIFVHFAPRLYTGATLGFPNPGRLGSYLSVHSVPDAVFACLLVALVAFAIWRSRRNSLEPLAEELPGWTCPACHEENPANFEECWKCQRIRTHEIEEK